MTETSTNIKGKADMARRAAPRPTLALGAPGMALSVVRDLSGFAALQPDWDRLAGSMSTSCYAYGFAWAETGWREVGMARGRRLHVVVGRERDRVVLIWPLATYTFKGCCKARWVGPEGSEYQDVLVEPGPGATDRVATALGWLRKEGEIDILHAQGVREDALVRPHLEAVAGALHRRSTVHLIDKTQWDSFASFLASRPAHFRRDQRRQWRRLAAQGRVAFHFVGPAAEVSSLVAWLHGKRAEALDLAGISANWFQSPQYLRFLVATAGNALRSGNLVLGELTVGKARAAAILGFRCRDRLELAISGYDRDWSAYSPGRLIMGAAIERGFADGIRWIDLRLGDQPYKTLWAEPRSFADLLLVPLTMRGRVLQGLRTNPLARAVRRALAKPRRAGH
jgi:CelD/BcsL family acetyltransferase involved in cellulose biosynthesis